MNTGFVVGSLSQDSRERIRSMFAVATAGQNMSFEFPQGTDYQVPTGYEFIITKISFLGSAANSLIALGYGNVGVPDQAAPPAGAVYVSNNYGVVVAWDQKELSVFIPCVALSYPFLKANSGNCTCHITGVERPV